MTSRDLFARSRELRLKLSKEVVSQAATTPLPPPTTTEASPDSHDAANDTSFASGASSSTRTSSSRPLSSSGKGTDSDSSFHYVNSNVTESPVSVSKAPVVDSEGFKIKGAAEAVASWKKDKDEELGRQSYEEESSFVTAPSSCKSFQWSRRRHSLVRHITLISVESNIPNLDSLRKYLILERYFSWSYPCFCDCCSNRSSFFDANQSTIVY